MTNLSPERFRQFFDLRSPDWRYSPTPPNLPIPAHRAEWASPPSAWPAAWEHTELPTDPHRAVRYVQRIVRHGGNLHAWLRATPLSSIDRTYQAIKQTARTEEDWEVLSRLLHYITYRKSISNKADGMVR